MPRRAESLRGKPELIPRAPPGVGSCRLLRVVGGSVAPHHRRTRVPKQELDVYLPRLILDRPGGEGVTELVGIDVENLE